MTNTATSSSRTASRSSSSTVRRHPPCRIWAQLTSSAEGFQVPPAELEDKLLGREDIVDVCVIGVWDAEVHSEVPRAYVVTSPGTQEDDALAKDIVQWLAGKVAPPKRLRGGVRFVKEVPKSASGKILRRLMRDQVKKEEGLVKAKL